MLLEEGLGARLGDGARLAAGRLAGRYQGRRRRRSRRHLLCGGAVARGSKDPIAGLAEGLEGRGVIVLLPAWDLGKGKWLIGDARLHARPGLFRRWARFGKHGSARADRDGHSGNGNAPKHSTRQQGTLPLCKPSPVASGPPGAG